MTTATTMVKRPELTEVNVTGVPSLAPEKTPSAIPPTALPSLTFTAVLPTPTLSSISTALPLPVRTPKSGPTFYNATFCVDTCRADGANASDTFPSGVTHLYVRWEYEDVTPGAHYERIWFNNGREWARYDCIWPGPSSGVDNITLSEPSGLHFGEWQLVIRVDEQTALERTMTLTGDHSYWSPAGLFERCYGKK